MKRRRNYLVPILMGSSIILLLVFQYFWLRSEYKTAEGSFRKETNLVFRTAVTELLDSLYMSKVDIFGESDSSSIMISRSSRIRGDDKIAFEALGKALRQEFTGRTLHVINDSIKTVPSKETPRINNIMIRINPDSLEVGSLATKYSFLLKEIERNVPFHVLVKDGKQLNLTDTAFVTDFIHIGPGSEYQYAASFGNMRLLLLKEIYPQIIFAMLLTMLTSGAFYLLYRNLQIQRRLVVQKDEFISNVSHELKTPIATVNVALEAFRNFKVLENPTRTKEYLDMAKAELDRLSLMTEKILNASVYENKGIDIEVEDVDVKKLVINNLNIIKAVWKKDGLGASEAYEGHAFIVKGSRLHLTNVLHNLLDNAVKYSNGDVKKIDIIVQELADHVQLRVSDQGIGIPKEYIHKIFEKFFRVPHGNIHNVKGYGLGLSYVAQVVKAHKGTIDVESEPGKGSSFIIKLPKDGQN